MAPRKRRHAPKAAGVPAARAAADAVLSGNLLPLVLAHCCGDVPTLCAAACVSRRWRAAAAQPQLWRELGSVDDGFSVRLTDERLEALISRACGVSPDGTPFCALRSLDLTAARHVTLPGVLHALRGPRAEGEQPLLLGALRRLRVIGVRGAKGRAQPSERHVDELQAFVAAEEDEGGVAPEFDCEEADGHLAFCTSTMLRPRRGIACTRLMRSTRACGECGVAVCDVCWPRQREVGQLCIHICSDCGNLDHMDWTVCPGCPNCFCSDCMYSCGCCGEPLICTECVEDDDLVRRIAAPCSGCSTLFCRLCADEGGPDGEPLLTPCLGSEPDVAQALRRRRCCSNVYCGDCECEQYLTEVSREELVEVLEEKKLRHSDFFGDDDDDEEEEDDEEDEDDGNGERLDVVPDRIYYPDEMLPANADSFKLCHTCCPDDLLH